MSSSPSEYLSYKSALITACSDKKWGCERCCSYREEINLSATILSQLKPFCHQFLPSFYRNSNLSVTIFCQTIIANGNQTFPSPFSV